MRTTTKSQPATINKGELRKDIIGLPSDVSSEARAGLKEASSTGDIRQYIHIINSIWNESTDMSREVTVKLNQLTTYYGLMERLKSRTALQDYWDKLAEQLKAAALAQELKATTPAEKEKLASTSGIVSTWEMPKDKAIQARVAQLKADQISDAEASAILLQIKKAKIDAARDFRAKLVALQSAPSEQTAWVNKFLSMPEFKEIAKNIADPNIRVMPSEELEKWWDNIMAYPKPARGSPITPTEIAQNWLLFYTDQSLAYQAYKINCQQTLPTGAALALCWGSGHDHVYPDMQDAWLSGTLPKAPISKLSSRQIDIMLDHWVEKLQERVRGCDLQLMSSNPIDNKIVNNDLYLHQQNDRIWYATKTSQGIIRAEITKEEYQEYFDYLIALLKKKPAPEKEKINDKAKAALLDITSKKGHTQVRDNNLTEGGSTFVVSMVTGNKIRTVNLADSYAYVAIKKKNGEVILKQLNEYQHTASNPHEQERIFKVAIKRLFEKDKEPATAEEITKMYKRCEKYSRDMLEQKLSDKNTQLSTDFVNDLRGIKSGDPANITARLLNNLVDRYKELHQTQTLPNGEIVSNARFKGSQVSGGITADMEKVAAGYVETPAHSVFDLDKQGIEEGDQIFLLHMTDGVLKMRQPDSSEAEISKEQLEKNIIRAVQQSTTAAKISNIISSDAFKAGTSDNTCVVVSSINYNQKDSSAFYYQGVLDGNGTGGAGNKVAYTVADYADQALQMAAKEMAQKPAHDAANQGLFAHRKGNISLPEMDEDKPSPQAVLDLIDEFTYFYSKREPSPLNLARVNIEREIQDKEPREQLIHLLARNMNLVKQHSLFGQNGVFHEAVLSKWPGLKQDVIKYYNSHYAKTDKEKLSVDDSLGVKAVQKPPSQQPPSTPTKSH